MFGTLLTGGAEAVGELIAEAFPAPDGCQVITGISECILGAKLLAPWVRDPSVRHRYTTDKYDKEATRVRYFILGMYDARVRCLPGVIETGVTDRVLGGDDCANLNPGGVTGKVRDTTDFGIVYTNVYKGTRERKRQEPSERKRQKPSTCTRCKTAGKPEPGGGVHGPHLSLRDLPEPLSVDDDSPPIARG